jgi:Fic family protein
MRSYLTASRVLRDGSILNVVRQRSFVGRRLELDVLQQEFEEVRRGASRVVLLEGPSGIGKTTLLERFLTRTSELIRPRLGEQRREQIRALLIETGAVTVAELQARFSVSPMTARRDLDELERRRDRPPSPPRRRFVPS